MIPAKINPSKIKLCTLKEIKRFAKQLRIFPEAQLNLNQQIN